MSEENKVYAPAEPACPKCESRRLVRAGVAYGKQRFRCKECGKNSSGESRQVKPGEACPACGGRCKKAGRGKTGRQQYRCTVCGKYNTDLYPSMRPSPGGPFPHHKRKFCLDFRAVPALIDYCNATGMSTQQAIRDIFRRAAQPWMSQIAWLTRPRFEGDEPRIVRASTETMPRELHYTNEEFPDARPESMRARMSRPPHVRMQPIVYVDLVVTVDLDDLAKEGLVRTMKAMKMNHQDAARYLITHVKPPPKAPR